MKQLKFYFAVSAAVALASCSNVDEPLSPGGSDGGEYGLAHPPKVAAYSGNTDLGGDPPVFKPKAVTDDEMKLVRQIFVDLDKHIKGNYSQPFEGVKLFNGFYDFNTNWLKDGSDFYVVNVVNGSSSNAMINKDLRFWHELLAYDISEDTYNNGDFTTLGYVESFLNYESYNSPIHIEKEIEDISFNDYNHFVFATNPLYNPDRDNYNKYGNYPPFRYVTIDGLDEDDNFEYAYIAVYYQECQPGQPGSAGTVKGDNEWDRVIRIAKPKTPQLPESGDGTEVTAPKNEVEVNLHASEGESHLSIHVRAATNVEIFIPVPEKYYCDADDMAIVMKHEPNHMGHGGPIEYTYQLKDSDLKVTLTLAFEEDGIRITTSGINEDVIAWCAEKCHGDGITFEVWNYFNEDLSKDQLIEYLNRATIKFLGLEPDAYINAFLSENDCTVSIVSEQSADYAEAVEGPHKNGSDNNLIYSKK